METKQQSQATTIENLKSETGWEFTVLLIKKKECTLSLLYKQRSDLATGLGALGVACECCLISKT